MFEFLSISSVSVYSSGSPCKQVCNTDWRGPFVRALWHANIIVQDVAEASVRATTDLANLEEVFPRKLVKAASPSRGIANLFSHKGLSAFGK
jgi:hypothetical protein